jgi:hypothetical protein
MLQTQHFDVVKNAEDQVKKIVMDTVQSLVVSSPVDTGAYSTPLLTSLASYISKRS